MPDYAPDGRLTGAGGNEGVPSAGDLDVARIVEAHHAVVYRYAFRLTSRAADAEDLTQMTFLTAVRKLDQLRQTERVVSWLLAVTRNAYLKQSRRRQPTAATSLGLELERVSWVEPPEGDLDLEQLQPALDELPEEFKVVVLMFYFEECSYKQIAEELQVPIGTVMSRLSRAKSHLRAKLAGDVQVPPARSESGGGVRRIGRPEKRERVGG
jgi:RNA polymerase sigma-70 factor (ECF subfamily)